MTNTSLNSLSLNFDAENMVSDLIKQMMFAVNCVADDMVNELNSFPFEYASGTFKKVVIDEGYDEIRLQVGSDHWYSLIVNYGSGSRMSKENPKYEEYTKGPYFNAIRSSFNNAVMTRPQGSYEVPNWVEGYGTTERTTKGGAIRNLEDSGYYKPVSPTFKMEDVFKIAKKMIRQVVVDVYNSFPYSDYLKGGGSR